MCIRDRDKETQVIANRLAELLTYHQIPITDERKTLGVRTIMVRRARKTGQVQDVYKRQIADTVVYVTSQPRRVQITDMTIMANQQATGFMVHKK